MGTLLRLPTSSSMPSLQHCTWAVYDDSHAPQTGMCIGLPASCIFYLALLRVQSVSIITAMWAWLQSTITVAACKFDQWCKCQLQAVSCDFSFFLFVGSEPDCTVLTLHKLMHSGVAGFSGSGAV